MPSVLLEPPNEHRVYLLRCSPHRSLVAFPIHPFKDWHHVRRHEHPEEHEKVRRRLAEPPRQVPFVVSRALQALPPRDHLDDRIESEFPEPLPHLDRGRGPAALRAPRAQLLDGLVDLRALHVRERVEARVREELDDGDLADLAPVRAVGGEPEHGIVVGHYAGGGAVGPARKGPVVGGETFFGLSEVAHDDGAARAEAEREDGPVLVGEGGEGAAEWAGAAEEREVADDGPGSGWFGWGLVVVDVLRIGF
ncbi:hypothetical protein QJS10_CPB17g02554 [Acorus calamus]|uniref:Uncharacterized protein n=1 Tax=Acorus calamus TaxID=4465 RepID=A0AAV9CQW4_ACOCL|nr:hypothetical protein QJS10_CPB17g02554 [Acorus calamus]